MWPAPYPTAVGVVCHATAVAGRVSLEQSRLRQH
jgi:hypothetical protein